MVSSSNGLGNGGNTSGQGAGFNNCSQVTMSKGRGLATGAGNGYGFVGCSQLQQNTNGGASKTATFNTSFADIATNATAATAAGGYNIA